MKRLIVPKLPHLVHGSSPDDIAVALDQLQETALTEVPWLAYPYKPAVHVKIAYTANSILLKYNVKEKHIKAEYRNTNDPVYNDSCVEFFLSFDGVHYYNLEFNCMGTGLIAYGNADKERRAKLANNVVEQVKTYSSINVKNSAEMNKEWSLLLDIPFNVFQADVIHTLNGVQCRGNFYKCGDELPIPHYVSWSEIDHPFPNFHLPKFFG